MRFQPAIAPKIRILSFFCPTCKRCGASTAFLVIVSTARRTHRTPQTCWCAHWTPKQRRFDNTTQSVPNGLNWITRLSRNDSWSSSKLWFQQHFLFRDRVVSAASWQPHRFVDLYFQHFHRLILFQIPESIPIEIVFVILSLLGPKELLKVSLLNSFYLRLSKDDSLWKPFCSPWGINQGTKLIL